MKKCFWLYGRSGSGKTTLARGLSTLMTGAMLPVFFIDGDIVRSGLSSDLGFSSSSRTENHRRMAHVAKIALDQGFNVVTASMAPEYCQRDVVGSVLGARLTWVYVSASDQVCEQRDTKGLYRSSRIGITQDFIGYPFEAPRESERRIVVDTSSQSVYSACNDLFDRLVTNGNFSDV